MKNSLYKLIPKYKNPNLSTQNLSLITNKEYLDNNKYKSDLLKNLISNDIKDNKNKSVILKNQLLNILLLNNLFLTAKKGYTNSNPSIINYNFNKSKVKNIFNIFNKLDINSLYRFLFLSFKSMYCLISKPIIISTSEVIKIQLFYFICLPKIVRSKFYNK